jgi:hypothetical protein
MSPSRKAEIIEKSKNFKALYVKYEQLHKQLSADPRKRNGDRMGQLLRLHEKLAGMKEEIYKAAEK